MNTEQPDNSPSVSVIICTYNRCESLRRTLQTCCDLVIPEGVTWELLVVDNNSTDHTKQVCESFSGKLPLRYIFEPRQGKTRAQNRAIGRSSGTLLLFTDDDVDVDRLWVKSLWDAWREQPEVEILGGKVHVHWNPPPPPWVTDNMEMLGGVITHFDAGEESRLLSANGPMVFGANMAFSHRLLTGDICFREDMGPTGSEYMTHEETSLIRNLIHSGHQCAYVPASIVYHRTSSTRATESWVRKWFTASGKSTVRFEGTDDIPHACFGAPRYLWRRLIEAGCRYAFTRWTQPSAIWLRHEIAMATTWGMICEHRRQSRMQKKSVVSTQ